MGAPDDDEDLARGRTLGRYVVLDRLGRGAMGSVHAAYDPELVRRVALKVLRPGAVVRQGHEAARQRLLREAQALARLTHPNVVRVFDVGTDAGRVFLAMELVEGQSLRRWLDVPRPWREVVELLEQAGRGLAAAHALGLVHRDFKPDNVLVAADGRARVGDFGLVRRVDAAHEEPATDEPADHEGHEGRAWDGAGAGLRTAAGDVLGTPAYMAPEQHAGDEAGPAADQYAFCVTLFEALYGRRPFGDADDRAALVEAKRRGLAGEGGSRGTVDRVPAAVRAVVRRGLSPEPADRFATMEALLDALGRARASVGTWRAVAAVAVVALGGLGIAVARPGQAEPACASAGRAPSAAWDEASRRAVLGRLDVHAPGDAGERTVTQLDGWVAAWAEADREACEATWVRGEQSRARLEARGECLHEQWLELEETASLLREADAATVARAGALVEGLPSPARCAGVRPGAGVRASEPGGDAADPTTSAARRSVARVAVLRRAGRLDAAWAELEAWDDVDGPARALARGQVLADRGEHLASELELHRALRLARARDDARTEAAAWRSMAAVAQARGHDGERAAFYLRMAAAADGDERIEPRVDAPEPAG